MLYFLGILAGAAIYCFCYCVHCFQKRRLLQGFTALFLVALPLLCGAVLVIFE